MKERMLLLALLALLMGCDTSGEKETSGNPSINGMWVFDEWVAEVNTRLHVVTRVSTPNIEMWGGWSGDYDSRCREILSMKWVNNEEIQITNSGGGSGSFKATFRKSENGRDLLELLPVGVNPTSLTGFTLDGETWARLTAEQFNTFGFSDNPDCTP
jgi:hypothetical protein